MRPTRHEARSAQMPFRHRSHLPVHSLSRPVARCWRRAGRGARVGHAPCTEQTLQPKRHRTTQANQISATIDPHQSGRSVRPSQARWMRRRRAAR